MTDCLIMAPGTGWIGPLAEAPDPVFADCIMGDGLLLDPTVGELRAPCAGKIASIARTKHAVTVCSETGVEILIHIGLETVALGGRGFDVQVQEGQSVKSGDLLVRFDIDYLAKNAKSLLTPIVIVNGDGHRISCRAPDGAVSAGDFIMEVRSAPTTADSAATIAPSSPATATATSKVIIPLRHGLHARPAARLVESIKNFRATVTAAKNGRTVSARSIVSLMGLGTRLGDEVVLSAIGSDAEAAICEAVKQIESGLGEEIALIAETSPSPGKVQRISAVEVEPVALDGSSVLKGVVGAPGLVIGKAVQMRRFSIEVTEQAGGAPEEEKILLSAAIGSVRKSIREAASTGSDQQREILNAHLALLDDPVLKEDAHDLIESGKSAAFSWRAVSQRQAEALSGLNDTLMAERAADLRDLELQVLSFLSGQKDPVQTIGEGDIVLAEELLPSQFIGLLAAKIGGLCTAGGGSASHVSILAAENGVPAIVAVGSRVLTIPDGAPLILEADRGFLHVAPTSEKSSDIEQRIEKRRSNQLAARGCAQENCYTADGERIEIFANLGSSAEALTAVRHGAEGCGLLRSEFLFLGRRTPPTEDEQLKEYQAIADALGPRPLVIRTLDIGGDKPVPYIDIPKEENPALGLRGVRVSLQCPEFLKTQFRAILRIKATCPIHIMLPMITSLSEMNSARKILDEARAELEISAPTSLGVMIETPASAVLADILAREADFFSIGTNDLTQYVLALDRGNTMIAAQMDSLHPAVLRMIKATAEAGRAHDKWVGACGALASDLVAAPILIGLGVKELSSTAASLPDLKAFVRTINYRECREAAEQGLNMSGPSEVREFVRAKWRHVEDWT